MLGVFLAVPRVVGENILGVFLAVPRVVGKNILEFFFDFGSYRARMQRRGHGCSAEGTRDARTTSQPDVRTTARSRPSVSPKAEAKGGVWGGREPPPAFPTGSLLDSLGEYEYDAGFFLPASIK